MTFAHSFSPGGESVPKKIKFAKGSQVKALNSTSHGSFLKGEFYTVREDFYEAAYANALVMVELDSIGSTTNGWGQKNFIARKAPRSKALADPLSDPASFKGEAKPTVLGTQIGGSHYTDCAIQPITYIWANGLGFSEGNIVKYISRWKTKGGIKDLRKMVHHGNLLIEEAEAEEARTGVKFGL